VATAKTETPSDSRAPLPSLGRDSLTGAALAAAATLAAWLLLPVLTPAHLEGFTAALAALGIHAANGTLPAFDGLQPLNAEYFGLTKLGAVLAVATAVGLGAGSDFALRLMMWIGIALLLGASAFLARRWSGARWPFVLAPLVLIPGIVESAYIYNDNVLAAGLAALGLCFLYARHRLGFVVAGLLLGFAVLTRTDTVLIGVCVPIILFERFGATRETAACLAVVGASAAASLMGPLAYFHSTVFDVIEVGSAAVEIWNRPTSSAYAWFTTLYFLGFPGLVLAAVGIAALARKRDKLAIARLLLPPLALLAVLFDKLWEIRQLLALTPFVCALAAIGLKALYEESGFGGRQLLRPAVAALALFCLAGPVSGSRVQDGPRVLTGRIWTIPFWRTWQQAPRHDLATLERIVRSASPAKPLVLFADEWTEDRYLHLTLLDLGYAPVATGSLAPPCRPIAELFSNGASTVLLVRLHHALVPYWREIKEERLALWALPCLRSLPPSDALFVATSAHARALMPSAQLEPAFGPAQDDPRRSPAVASTSYGPIVALPLTSELQRGLSAGYRSEAAPLLRKSARPRPTVRDAMEASRARTRFPGQALPDRAGSEL
jgi:hypothetical protein